MTKEHKVMDLIDGISCKRLHKERTLLQKDFRKDLQELLQKYTTCTIQHNKYPCNTCFFNLCKELGLSNEYAEKLWHCVLVIRGDYREKELTKYKKEIRNFTICLAILTGDNA